MDEDEKEKDAQALRRGRDLDLDPFLTARQRRQEEDDLFDGEW